MSSEKAEGTPEIQEMEEIPVTSDYRKEIPVTSKTVKETVSDTEAKVFSDVMKSLSFMFQDKKEPKDKEESSNTEIPVQPTYRAPTPVNTSCPYSGFDIPTHHTYRAPTPVNTSCPYSGFNSIFNEQFITTLTSLLMTYLSSSAYKTSSTKPKDKCPMDDIIKDFTGLWDGLNGIENKKVRAICFMNNLNKFHDSIWKYAKTHNNTTLGETTLNLTLEKLHTEIINVMEQLHN